MIRNWMRLRREISNGGTPPRGWRMAWYEPQRRVAVCYPAPAHVLVRLGREMCHRIRLAYQARSVDDSAASALANLNRERLQLAEEYAKGYMAGWNECFQACTEAVREEFARSEQSWRAGGLFANDSTGTRRN